MYPGYLSTFNKSKTTVCVDEVETNEDSFNVSPDTTVIGKGVDMSNGRISLDDLDARSKHNSGKMKISRGNQV